MSGLPIVKFQTGSPLCTLHNVRSLVGKSVTLQILKECLMPQNNKLHWVVNSYFRNACQNDSLSRCRFRTNNAASELLLTISLQSLPIELVMKILSYLDCVRSLIRMVSTNRFFRKEFLLNSSTYYSALWVSMLKNYYYIAECRNGTTAALVVAGRWIGDNLPAPTFFFQGVGYYFLFDLDACDGEEMDYLALFQQCYHAELKGYCLHCNGHMNKPVLSSSMIIPILYGYPSSKLINYHMNGLIALGGDYLLEGVSNWRCRSCQAEFYSYPYHCAWMDMEPH